MASIWNKAFWKDAAERVIFTAAQAGIGVLAASGIVGFGTWGAVAVIGTAAAAALLKAVVAALAVDNSISPASVVK